MDMPTFLHDLPLDEAQIPIFPVETWNPPFCGDIDMRIRADGSWWYNGSAIQRTAMVRLFSRLLRREAERYVLVTPVEKLGITVEDVPFMGVEMAAQDGALTFRTNVGDIVTAGPDHPLRFDTGAYGFRPYVEVRAGLEARLTRALAQDLAAGLEQRDGWFGITSGGVFFRAASTDAAFL